MENFAWGPIPELARFLRLRGRRRAAEPVDVLAVEGSPWRLYARSPARRSFWPPTLPPPKAVPTKPRTAITWILRLFSQSGVDDTAHLRDLLCACHAWLGAGLTRYLVPYSAPFWGRLPSSLVQTGDASLVAALLIHGALTDSPGLLLRYRGLISMLERERQFRSGDVLALHWLTEVLAAELHAQLGIVAELPAERRLGGLRTRQFLSVYPRLTPRSRDTMDGVLEVSPLSRLVYLDLAPTGSLSPSLDLVLCLDEKEPGSDGEQGWWLEMWYAHIARSLLGALASPPLGLPELRAAEAEVKRLEREARFLWVPPRLHTDRALARARTRRDALRAALAAHYTARFGGLQWFGSAGASAPGKVWVQLLLLDMLARHALSAALPAIVHEWQRSVSDAGRAGRQPDFARQVLFQPGSAYRQDLNTKLFAGPLRDLNALLNDQQREIVRAGLSALLTPFAVPDAAALARDAQIHGDGAPRLLERFTASGVRLPFAWPHDTGPAPMEIGRSWLEEIRASV